MKEYFKKISLFLLSFLGLIILVQLILSFNIRNKSITGHDNLKQTEHIDADLVFMGSSRCRAHFDPLFFDSAYHLKSVNLGIDGHSEIAMQLLRLRLYLNSNKAPRYVIFNFDPLVQGGSSEHNTNFVHKNDFARYAFFPDKGSAALVDYFHFNIVEKYVPLFSILKYQLFSECLSRKGFPYSRNFYDKHASPAEIKFSDNADNVKLPKLNADVIRELKDSLSIFNEFCKSNKIQLICIQTPIFKSLYDSTAFSYPAQICRELNIPFINACVESIRDDRDNFYNADHMNVIGVTKMNAYLKTDSLLTTILH